MRARVALAAVAMVLHVAPLRAQDDETARKAAIEIVARGDAAFKARDYPGALAAYQEAYQVFPSAKLFYPMAKAEEKLGRTLDALGHYERFLAEAKDIHEDLRIDVEVSISELGKQIAVVSFVVTPADATVIVDGVPVDPRQPLRLVPSKHAVIVEKPGFEPHSEAIEPAAGERPTLEITLQPVAAPPPAVVPEPVPPPPAAADEPGLGWPFWTGVGATAALTAGWAVTGLLAQGEHDDFTNSNLGLDERSDARDRGKQLALTSDLCLAGALIAGGVTAWLYFGRDDHEPRQALAPLLVPGGAGAAFAGEF